MGRYAAYHTTDKSTEKERNDVQTEITQQQQQQHHHQVATLTDTTYHAPHCDVHTVDGDQVSFSPAVNAVFDD